MKASVGRSLMTVSYTHLDVYKRQLRMRAKIAARACGWDVLQSLRGKTECGSTHRFASAADCVRTFVRSMRLEGLRNEKYIDCRRRRTRNAACKYGVWADCLKA